MGALLCVELDRGLIVNLVPLDQCLLLLPSFRLRVRHLHASPQGPYVLQLPQSHNPSFPTTRHSYQNRPLSRVHVLNDSLMSRTVQVLKRDLASLLIQSTVGYLQRTHEIVKVRLHLLDDVHNYFFLF
jgi:hypothetical protein